MPEVSHQNTEPAQSTGDTWPWACLDCGATIYHDGLFCADCETAHELDRLAAQSSSEDDFGSWIRDQSYPSFVTTVTTVASLEVALTAFWLQLLLVGPAGLVQVTPGF